MKTQWFQRRNAVLLLGTTITALYLGIFLRPTPSYEGKTAEAWVNRLISAPNYVAAVDSMNALKAIGEPAATPLIQTLNEPLAGNYYVREALQIIGEPAVGPLIKYAENYDGDWDRMIRRLWQASPSWIRSWFTPPPHPKVIRSQVYSLLSEIDPSSDLVLEALLRGASDQEPSIRATAMSEFGQMDQRFAPKSVPILIVGLSNTNASIRSLAARCLSGFAPSPTTVIPKITALLKDADYRVRHSAIGALERIGDDSPPVRQALRDTLRDRKPICRAAAARALWKLGIERKAVLQTFREDLKRNSDLKWPLQSLTAIGKEIEILASDVETLLQHNDLLIRAYAASALCAMTGNSSKVLPVFAHVIKQGTLLERTYAILSLGKLGTEVEPAARLLIGVIEEPQSEGEKLNAILALCKLRPSAADAISHIEQELNSPFPFVQKKTYETLEAIRVERQQK